MVAVSATAHLQLRALETHFVGLGRGRALDNLISALADASARVERQAEVFLKSPRPYPSLASYGWSWLKAGRYWFAFTSAAEGDWVITGVFYEAADIPRRV